jgi:hypothetical protein
MFLLGRNIRHVHTYKHLSRYRGICRLTCFVTKKALISHATAIDGKLSDTQMNVCLQVGTSFAFAKESGLMESVKRDVLRKVIQAPRMLRRCTCNHVLFLYTDSLLIPTLQVQNGDLTVFTDPVASPTGFPFKVKQSPSWTMCIARVNDLVFAEILFSTLFCLR